MLRTQARDAVHHRFGTLYTPDSGCCVPRLGTLRTPFCGTVRGSVRLVRSKITVKICPKCKHFVLHFNSYLGVLNNYKLNSSQQTFVPSYISLISVISVPI